VQLIYLTELGFLLRGEFGTFREELEHVWCGSFTLPQASKAFSEGCSFHCEQAAIDKMEPIDKSNGGPDAFFTVII
jgi:hypothetical protein